MRTDDTTKPDNYENIDRAADVKVYGPGTSTFYDS